MRTLIIFLLLSCIVNANEFTRSSPNGDYYDVRTYYFNKEKGRVLVRPQFEGLSDADRCSLIGLKHIDNNPEWKQAQVEWQEELDKRNQLIIKKAQSRTTYNTPVRTIYMYYNTVPFYQQLFNYHNGYNHNHYNSHYNGYNYNMHRGAYYSPNYGYSNIWNTRLINHSVPSNSNSNQRPIPAWYRKIRNNP